MWFVIWALIALHFQSHKPEGFRSRQDDSSSKDMRFVKLENELAERIGLPETTHGLTDLLTHHLCRKKNERFLANSQLNYKVS